MKKVVFLILLGCLASCRDFLEIKPRDEVIPTTVEEFSALIHYILDRMDYAEDDVFGNIVGTPWDSFQMETVSDNFEAAIAPIVTRMNNYIGDIVGGGASYEHYAYPHKVISRCNMVLDNMEDRESRAAKDLLATVYALRGVSYYNLLKLYCDMRDPDNLSYQAGLPLIKEFDMEERPARSSLAETISFIESDFNNALALNNQNGAYRFNNDVVKGYLARLYFWAGMYDKAIAPAEEILTKYPMLSGAEYLDMMKNSAGKQGNFLIKPISADKVSLDYNAATAKLRPLSRRFTDLFVEKDNDVRYNLTALMTKQNWRICVRPAQCGMRSDEMCLILAESYYHEGNTDKALQYLNLLRNNRITGNTDYTMATLPAVGADYIVQDAQGNTLTPLIWAILSERRKEFFMEGDRFFELKRNGRPEWWVPRSGQKLVTRYFMYNFPFPYKDVAMTDGFVQNPGYESVQ